MSPLVLVALYNNRHWQSGKLPHGRVDSNIMGKRQNKSSRCNDAYYPHSLNFVCISGVGYFIPVPLPRKYPFYHRGRYPDTSLGNGSTYTAPSQDYRLAGDVKFPQTSRFPPYTALSNRTTPLGSDSVRIFRCASIS